MKIWGFGGIAPSFSTPTTDRCGELHIPAILPPGEKISWYPLDRRLRGRCGEKYCTEKEIYQTVIQTDS
jgi:hypothetical protein